MGGYCYGDCLAEYLDCLISNWPILLCCTFRYALLENPLEKCPTPESAVCAHKCWAWLHIVPYLECSSVVGAGVSSVVGAGVSSVVGAGVSSVVGAGVRSLYYF